MHNQLKFHKIYLLFNLIPIIANIGSTRFKPIDPREGEMLVRQFIERINFYCTENYDYSTQIDIIEENCDDPQIKVTNDIPEMKGEETEINTYLMNLRTYSVLIEYDKDIKITRCYRGSNSFWGCQVFKTIKSYKGISKCLETIEIIETGKGLRIAGTISDILKPLEFYCENGFSNPDSNSCKLMDLAESELRENKVELAIAHYEQAKTCGGEESKLLASKAKEINLDSIYLSSFKIGNLLFEEGKYNEALTYYRSIMDSYKTISINFLNKVENKINQCRSEIEYYSIIKIADYYFEKGYYDKALSEYSKALNIKTTVDNLSRKKFCEQKVKEQYYRISELEIKKAERLITEFKKFTEGFSILMKYVHSDRLSGYHFFLMAQIVDSPSRKTIQEFNLSSRKRCFLTRQFLLNAHALGYESEGFDVYWNEYLNEKSRTCD